jgi:hypothetical protein
MDERTYSDSGEISGLFREFARFQRFAFAAAYCYHSEGPSGKAKVACGKIDFRGQA